MSKELTELTGAELVEDFEERIDRLYFISKYYENNNIKMPEWIEDKVIAMGELIKKLGL